MRSMPLGLCTTKQKIYLICLPFSGQGLSRAAYAKLYTAGFPPVLDRKGEAPEVVDPADQINFVAANEEAGKLQANEIILQFLAFAR